MTDKAPVTVEQGDETLEQYADRIVSATRKKFLERLDDDVIGCLGDSHLIFGKACAMEAVTTAMHEMSDKIAEEKAARGLQSVAALEEEIKRLREALEPFARAAEIVDRYDADFPDDGACLRTSFAYWSRATGDDVVDTPRMRDLRRARTALEGGGS
ncbi:hypothetical protein [Sphingobium chungbukense]|uniref:Uncharacterized protein n=1 Tax=Sphingobium chungbukense TaxID=56193 RepID=A0A0M3AS06_9SPHN|nr:hypothetical protein [Sphingobium chungbukense]KKW92635.1 hypothetical protein YP76_06780 [Sphingobium chungbukense]